MKTDWDLIRSFMNGEYDAGSKFLLLYSPAIRGYVKKKNLEKMGDDLEQQILMGLVRELKRPGFDESKAQFRGLLFTCIKRAVIDHYRKDERSLKALPLLPGQDIEAYMREEEWDEIYDDNFKRQALRNVQVRVGVSTWSAFIALTEAKKSPEEVAKEFGHEVQWVYDLKRRILRMFREECRKLDPDIHLE